MEAVWTRYFPLFRALSNRVKAGEIGTVTRVWADLSFWNDLDNGAFSDENRMVNLDLAGGALLDLGIYSLTWVFEFLYHIAPADKRGMPKVAAAMTKYARTGSDEATSMILTFPTGAHGIATTHLRASHNPDGNSESGPCIRIQGSAGEIQLFGDAYKPSKYRIYPQASNKDSTVKFEEKQNLMTGRGMYFEADEAARCIRDGKKESEGLPLEESIVMMRVMDEARKEGGLKYPDRIESTEYPLDGF